MSSREHLQLGARHRLRDRSRRRHRATLGELQHDIEAMISGGSDPGADRHDIGRIEREDHLLEESDQQLLGRTGVQMDHTSSDLGSGSWRDVELDERSGRFLAARGEIRPPGFEDDIGCMWQGPVSARVAHDVVPVPEAGSAPIKGLVLLPASHPRRHEP